MPVYGAELEHLLFVVATNLFYPILIVEILALIYVLVEFGAFLYEKIGHRLYRDFGDFDQKALLAEGYLKNGRMEDAAQALPALKYSGLLRNAIIFIRQSFVDGTFYSKSEKIMQTAEIMASRQLQGPRLLTRVGPMLGLMGTLIPLGPALQALTKGDLQTMANNLTIAFVTTIIGLLIGGIGYTINLFRDGMLTLDLSDLEYLLAILNRDNRQEEAGRCAAEEPTEECLTATGTP